MQLTINGHQTVDYTEPDKSIPQMGVIGLQIHVGAPSEAWYKDIELVKLPPCELTASVARNDRPTDVVLVSSVKVTGIGRSAQALFRGKATVFDL